MGLISRVSSRTYREKKLIFIKFYKMSDLRRPSKNNPRGTEAYDLGALSPDQQLQLNEQNLLKHPEIKAVLEESLQFLLVNRPESGEEIRKVLSDFFKSKADELQATK